MARSRLTDLAFKAVDAEADRRVPASSAGDTAVLRIAGLTPWRAVAASAAITALVQLARQTEAAVRLEEALHSSTAWITAVH